MKMAMIVLSAILLASTSLAQEQPPRSAKQIVILYTHRTLTPINADWDRGIRGALAKGFEEPLDIEVEYLNLVRHKDPAYLQGWIELLRTKYATRPPDLVMPVYVPALEFTLEQRETVFPRVPIVFCSAPRKLAERAHAEPRVAGVAFQLDFSGTIRTALQLRPTTNRLIVVSGSAVQDRALKAAAERAILAMNTGLPVEFIEGLPTQRLLDRMALVDSHSAVLLLTCDQDSQGNHYSTVEVAEQLSAICPAPVFGVYDTLLGHGIVGGSLGSAETQGTLAGQLAVRVLQGERPEDLPIVGLDGAQYTFDARQLQRWHISEASLPPASRVHFREPTFWGQFGQYVLAGAAAICLQSLIIVALLVNRSRRVRAERDLIASRGEARDLAGKILTAQEDERRYLAREMHDDISQRLAAAAIEAGQLEQRFPDAPDDQAALSTMKGRLIGICEDVHRLSRQIHPAVLDDFGLADALRSECERWGAGPGIAVEFRCGDVPADLPKDIALCLYRIAQEAIWNSSKYSHSNRAVVELNADPEFVYLDVRDFGQGFEPQNASCRGGLGLASMRERARLVRGTISIESAPGVGATIAVRVPLPEQEP